MARTAAESEPLVFSAVFNALYSCCWLIQAELDFDILLAVIRSGDDLPADHPLIVQRRQLAQVTESVVKQIGPTMQVGPAQPEKQLVGDSRQTAVPAQKAKIACLGWGSLTWNPESLLVDKSWFTDGPSVQVEFLRQSKDDRMTLVLDESAAPVPSLWARMTTNDIGAAVSSLQARERTSKRNIGIWTTGDNSPSLIFDLPAWAAGHHLDAVIWTNLGRKFGKLKRAATADEVIAHLNRLTGQKLRDAEEYVRRAPRQIATPYRKKIVEALGWGHSEN